MPPSRPRLATRANPQVFSSATNEPVTLYLESLAPSGRRSMHSLLTRAAAILGHTSTLETMPWAKVHYPHLAQVRAHLLAEQRSINTVNTTLSALRGVLKAAFYLGQIPASQWLQLDAVKRVQGHCLPAGRALSKREVQRLLGSCARQVTSQALRDRAIIELMLFAGLRRGEVASLAVDDYPSRQRGITIRHAKGRQPRQLILPATTHRAVQAWLRRRGGAPGALFCPLAPSGTQVPRPLSTQAVYDIITRRAAQAGIAHCSPHDLRRTFITRLLQADVDLNTVRQLAGHRDIKTTVRYDRRELRRGALALQRIAN